MKSLILLAINDLIHFISSFVPKDSNLWIFGAWSGEKYIDNSKYLFEYVNKPDHNIKAYWFTQNKEIFDLVKEKGYNVCYSYSLKGYWLTMKAGIAIVTHSKLLDLNNSISSKTKVVQLWHGTPLKKILYDDKISIYGNTRENSIKNRLVELLLPILFDKYDYSLLIAPSEKIKDNFASAFKISKNKIVVTGYPRNDALFKKLKVNTKFKKCIYMPTFRNGNNLNLFSNFGFNVRKIDEFLENNNVQLYLKLHPGDAVHSDVNIGLKKKIKDSNNIFFIKDTIDIYSHLKEFDFLITDYSSIYFDYLLLNRPIIFAPFDMDSYIKDEREFYYEYNKVTPGPKAKNWPEVMRYIKEAIIYPNKYTKERLRINKFFNKYSKSDSSKRVFEEIIKLTQKEC